MSQLTETKGDIVQFSALIAFFVALFSFAYILFFHHFEWWIANLIFLSLIVGAILYISPRFFYHIDYHSENFGLFETKIHNSFNDPWKSSYHVVSNCLIAKFDGYGRSREFTHTVTEPFGNGRYRKYNRRESGADYFDIYYFAFPSPAEREAKEKDVIDYLKDDKKCSVKSYVSDNVLIAFKCYSISTRGMGSAYPFLRSLVTRKAVSGVKLNPDYPTSSDRKPFVISYPDSKYDDFAKLLSEIGSTHMTLYSQYSLTNIMINDEDGTFGELMDRIGDYQKLKKIALYAKNESIAKKALEKIPFQSTLAEIAKSSNAAIALNAVEMIDDEENLKDIGENAINESVRKKASEKIAEKSTASESTEKESDILEGITDDDRLAEIIRTSDDEDLRKRAAEKITDQSVLADILKQTEDRSMASLLDVIYDQSILLDIAENAKDSGIHYDACERISNKELVKIVKSKWIMTCKKCGGSHSIVGTHYNKQFDWFFYDLKCKDCGHLDEIPQHLLDDI